jgi:hypothetical protein
VVFFCVLLIVAGLMLYNFWEWYNVEQLHRTEAYNFGENTNRAYYYQSEALYAFIHLFWSICFGVSFALMLLAFAFKVRWYKVVCLIISLIVTSVYIFHGLIA